MHAAVGPGGGGSSARCDSQWATAPRLPTPAVRRGGEAAVAPAPPPTGTLPRRSRQLHRCGGCVQRVGPVCPGGPPSNGWQRASTIIAASASTAATTAAPSPPNACLNLRLALDRVNACVADSPHAAAYVMAPPHSADMTCEVTRVPDSMDRTPSVTSLDVASDVSSLLSKAGPPLPKEPWATEEDAANGQRMTVLYEEDASTGLDRLEDATLAGLSLPVKGLSSMYFYDDKGSQLFRHITNLPEYYLTAAEAEIIDTHGGDMLAAAGVCSSSGPVNVIELGAGDGCKTVSLLRHLARTGAAAKYAPIDISREAMRLLFHTLERSAAAGDVPVHGVVGDYLDALDFLVSQPGSEEQLPSPPVADLDSPVTSPSDSSDEDESLPAADAEVVQPVAMPASAASPAEAPRNLVVFLGSSLGNFAPADALAFLRSVCSRLRPGDGMLIGYDLKKSPTTLVPAYADASGVTAAFNYNLLDRLNRDVGGDFDTAAFEHQALYNPVAGTMESYLLSTRPQTVHVGRGARRTAFALEEWEPIHTEYSHKYTTEQMGRLAADAGFAVVRNFTDAAGRFVDAVWVVV
ncbi:hypothetical protein I4F81_004692 [Pyropia yezoensis]|uniref:Uncharacterized protein n=1 Tax=Pyropia yezoensis TaxID=2788 RepID=A0ACC3BXB6_PYRYE|nr:hypothetical protein I4F81_004692 [Neopyropia yezoensis]